MDNREQREHEFNKRLAEEVAGNIEDIKDMIDNGKVGQCGGKCKGFQENDLSKLCSQCLQALEEEADEIFRYRLR